MSTSSSSTSSSTSCHQIFFSFINSEWHLPPHVMQSLTVIVVVATGIHNYTYDFHSNTAALCGPTVSHYKFFTLSFTAPAPHASFCGVASVQGSAHLKWLQESDKKYINCRDGFLKFQMISKIVKTMLHWHKGKYTKYVVCHGHKKIVQKPPSRSKQPSMSWYGPTNSRQQSPSSEARFNPTS